MRVLFTSLRNTGHFQPLVPFIEACLARGHEVAVGAPAELTEQVVRSRAQFFPVGHPGDAGLGPIWARMRAASEADAVRLVIEEVFAGACAEHALPALCAAVEQFRPDLLVREAQEYAAVIAAEKLGLPHARVAISLAESQLFLWSRPALERHRAALGLASDPEGRALRNEPTFSRFPCSFDVEAGEPGILHRFRASLPSHPPLSFTWSDASVPLVYLTLGTVTGSTTHIQGVYRTVLDAVADLPLRVLLTTGAELPPETLGAVPPHVQVARFVPQDQVLPEARAVVCHGGSGTVLGALAHGVPMVVVPLFADQPQNAERVEAIGAGIQVPRPASAPAIRAALSRVLAEPAFKASALHVRDEIAALPSIDQAPLAFEQIAREASRPRA
ncbi:MAG: glycosyltransferase [Myxococcales bacterium]